MSVEIVGEGGLERFAQPRSPFFGGSAEQAAAALLGMSDTHVDGDTLVRLTQQVNRAREEGR